MKTTLKIIVLPLITVALTACGGPGQSAKEVAENSVEHVGCKTSQSEMWNSLHLIAEQQGKYPQGEELREALIAAGEAKGLKGKAFLAYVDAFVANYTVTIEGIKEKFAPNDVASWKKALAEMEIGIRVTDVHAELQSKIAATLSDLSNAERALNAVCDQPEDDGRAPAGELDPPPTTNKEFETVWEQLKAERSPESYGARKVLATLYQSCGVLNLPAMTSTTPSISGITILSEKHPAGGLKRVYGSVASIDASHYYIKNQTLAKSSCYEVRNTPPIYDFGGKPYTTSSKPSVLDFFKDGGTGTAVLGYDCSAFVFSALAMAGLKMDPDPNKPLKADLVHGIGSRAFKEPQSNGLRCLDKIKVTKDLSIQDGDIAAINGHVVMIDDVGPDPFGIKKITKIEDCNTAHLPYSEFDFVIAQSSPSKSGMGVNRFQARDYFKETTTYRDGLTRYAIAACKAKFGTITAVDTTSLAVVRHKKTQECKAPPLTANHEDCVDSCQPL
jgi:hypothetical protein